MRRASCISLNGSWDFAIGQPDATHDRVKFDKAIAVPFAPECSMSGVGHEDYIGTCWYRRTFKAPQRAAGERLRLVFEAVDYRCQVWVNGHHVGDHVGGYTRFEFDVTSALVDGPEQTVVLRVEDDPHDMSQPRGKQEWKPKPHAIWYPRTTGIWQSVWMEVVPATRIRHLTWTPNVRDWQIGFEAELDGPGRLEASVRVTLHFENEVILRDTLSADRDGVRRVLGLRDPGIEDAKNDMLWKPGQPKLIEATVELLDSAGNVVDTVESYTAMRSSGTMGTRFTLNGRPTYLRLLLDQGYWPESGLTAPDDEALKRDVELIKALGYNGVRKHQKIECERFLYWADVLGVMVWEELPSAYAFTPAATERLADEWKAAIRRDRSHPCIVAYVPVNESWGFPDLELSEAQRNGVRALYYLTKTLDPTRPVISNDGWEPTETDMVGVHDYAADPQVLLDRYDTTQRDLKTILATVRPGNRALLLDAEDYVGQPTLMTEFGGIAFSPDEQQTWGYSRATDATDYLRRYAGLLEAVRKSPAFCGLCYTQLTDTYQEANGILKMDRTPKADLELLRIATVGPRDEAERAKLAEALEMGK